MSKNIVIAEGGVGTNFTAKKLKTNLQGGGNCTWIPEDEAADYCTFKELKVTANGTYKASDKNCDGFDKVKVEISADVVQQKTITTNGEYDAMQDEGRVGYAHVTVNVPGGGGGPFTVLFLDDEGNVLKKQENVPYGGYASCTALDGTILNGLYFKGWNPVPKNVQFNMTCRPVRGDYVISPGEIQDDWETIVADGGAHYPLGSYKPLVFDIPEGVGFSNIMHHFYFNGVYYDDAIAISGYGQTSDNLWVRPRSVALHMVKVAEGEDGSTSSWISDGALVFDGSSGADDIAYDHYQVGEINHSNVREGWANSKMRKYLNENFLDAMPDVLKNAIVPVNKTFKSSNYIPGVSVAVATGGTQMLDQTSIDYIWVPSVKEFHTYLSGMSGFSEIQPYAEELSGVDYSTIFVPAFANEAYTFRSIGAIPGYGYNFITLSADGAGGGSINWSGIRRALFGFCL